MAPATQGPQAAYRATLLLHTLLYCFVLLGLGSLLPHLAPCSSLPMWDDRGTPRGWRGTSRLPVSRCITPTSLLHPGQVQSVSAVRSGLQFLQHFNSQPQRHQHPPTSALSSTLLFMIPDHSLCSIKPWQCPPPIVAILV